MLKRMRFHEDVPFKYLNGKLSFILFKRKKIYYKNVERKIESGTDWELNFWSNTMFLLKIIANFSEAIGRTAVQATSLFPFYVSFVLFFT